MDNGFDHEGAREISNDELVAKLDSLVENDEERRFHTRVINETFNKALDRPDPIDEGYLVAAGENKHVIIQETSRGKKVLVISPSSAPGTETEEQLREYFDLIRYDPRERRFTDDFYYSYSMSQRADQTTDLRGHLNRMGVLIADSGSKQEPTVRRALNEAIAYGRSRISSDQGPPQTSSPS